MDKVRITRLALVVAVAVVAAASTLATSAHAQSAQSEARRLYREGRALYDAGKYQPAIDKFKKADRLAPAALLDFNIGLAYDRMGEKERALKHYESFLQRAPNANNRDVVRGKINRIQGELRAEAAARKTAAAERDAAARAQREAEVARAAAAERAAADRVAAEKAAANDVDDADKTVAAQPAVVPPPGAAGPPPPPAEDDLSIEPDERAPASSQGAAAGGQQYPPTGDPGLDRVAAIDINAIRERRGLAGGAGAGAVSGGRAEPSQPTSRPSPTRPIESAPKKSKPAYKQWWFWVIVGVSAVILIDIASTGDDGNSFNTRLVAPMNRPSAATPSSAVLLRF